MKYVYCPPQVNALDEDQGNPGDESKIPPSPTSPSESLNVSGEEATEESENKTNTAGSILSILNGLLDSEVSYIAKK